MRVALLQSNYIPWIGYFDMINSVDHFVLYDTVQYTKNDWRNRNKILTTKGETQWLTVPVRVKSLGQTILETELASSSWRRKHWNSLQLNYSKRPCFGETSEMVKTWYEDAQFDLLSPMNRHFIESICQYLEINTPITDCREYDMIGDKQERIISLCKELGADEYLSGSAAKSYIDTDLFEENGIRVAWMNYGPYLPYSQSSKEMNQQVSILDVIFNLGKEAKTIFKDQSKSNV